MDRDELLNDDEAAMRAVLDGRQSVMWTAMPGIVLSVNRDQMTVEVQLSIQGAIADENGNVAPVNLPPLVNVPIVFPSAGGFLITLPIAEGDEVLVVFGSRCIDSWWQSGGIQRPMESRMHDLSDGFAIPGPRSLPEMPGGSISATDLEIRNDAGTTYLSITATGTIGLQNPVTSLNLLLTELNATLAAFMATLAGFGGGVAPVTQVMLQAPAATAVAGLTSVLAKIGALLKP